MFYFIGPECLHFRKRRMRANPGPNTATVPISIKKEKEAARLRRDNEKETFPAACKINGEATHGGPRHLKNKTHFITNLSDTDKLHNEGKRRIRRNNSAGALRPVGKARRADQFALAANLHRLQPLVPTGNHMPELKLNRLVF